ncbi:hypothetical protein [Rathayibacter sp. VKM Ac-2857]|uniref:hypothetical protein n=1 Tax=Rathayibacter sp. VKM Ac-2857 TaxID=2739020 RepID=UPI001C20A2B1|nr:hypothetical protein [Rathayibacter sp. VKM Ac-2857]NQX16696.1 hypothetical protein [Rathayibacter sp. VKM Ac-2857]
MRNTRTAAACLAATTLFGLLSATPAIAEPAPTPTTIAPVPTTAAPEPTPTTIAPTPTTAAPEPTPTAIAPTPTAAAAEPAAVPTPAEPAPGAAPSAQPALVIATLSDDGALVSLSDDLYRSEKRIVVIVEGKPVAQIQNKQTRGVATVTPDSVDGRSVLHIPGVKPGDRMAVTEYVGSLDDGFDDSLRRTRLYAAQLGDAAPASTEAAPGAAPIAQQPFVIATLSDEGVLVSVSDDLYRSDKRFVVIVEGKPVAQIQNKQTRGVARVVPDVVDGPTVLYIPGVKPGDRLAVTEYAGSLDDGFDDTLRRTRLYTAQLGDAAPTGGQPAPVSTEAPTPGPVAGAGTAKDAPVVTVSYEDHRAVFSLSEDVATSTARVWISVNGVKIGSVWNDELTGLSGAYYSGHRLYFTADVQPGDQVKVTLEGGNGSGADEDAPERVLFEGTL